MKLKNILGLLLVVAAFSMAASAQLPSLANVGDDMYTSEEDGFEIAVPDGCMKESKSATERTYRCELVEGIIIIQVQEGTVKIQTDKDVRDYLAGFRSGFEKNVQTKLLNESPAKIGEYKGASYTASVGDEKALVIALAWQNFSVTILGRANSKVANSAELIAAAVQSFAFNSDEN